MASSRQRGPTTGNRPGRVLPVLALVAATALVLVGAGLGDSPRQRSLSSLSSEQVTRSMTCSAGLPGGEAVSGSLEGSVSTSRPSKSGVSKIATAGAPMVVRAAHASAPGAYASQSAATPNWYAAQPCPAPAAQQWFVGAGGSHPVAQPQVVVEMQLERVHRAAPGHGCARRRRLSMSTLA